MKDLITEARERNGYALISAPPAMVAHPDRHSAQRSYLALPARGVTGLKRIDGPDQA
jgi:hypothetical protein